MTTPSIFVYTQTYKLTYPQVWESAKWYSNGPIFIQTCQCSKNEQISDNMKEVVMEDQQLRMTLEVHRECRVLKHCSISGHYLQLENNVRRCKAQPRTNNTECCLHCLQLENSVHHGEVKTQLILPNGGDIIYIWKTLLIFKVREYPSD